VNGQVTKLTAPGQAAAFSLPVEEANVLQLLEDNEPHVASPWWLLHVARTLPHCLPTPC
jgi:hypothetical protein